jgi:hypothetical protein
MHFIHHPVLVLSLCLSALAVACDSSHEPLASPSEALELSMWPALPPDVADEAPDVRELTAAVESAAKKPKPPKPKHLVASDAEAAAWVKWVLALPDSNGPVSDPDGSHCGWGQGGPLWFLAGTSGGPVERECQIPKGKDLVFPLVNRWCVFFPEFYPTEESIEAATPAQIANLEAMSEYACSLTLRVDGVDMLAKVEDFDSLFVLTEERFPVDVNEDNFASEHGVAGGPTEALTGGHYVRLKALKPGDHVLELGGALCWQGEVFFETYAKYDLHVGD